MHSAPAKCCLVTVFCCQLPAEPASLQLSLMLLPSGLRLPYVSAHFNRNPNAIANSAAATTGLRLPLCRHAAAAVRLARTASFFILFLKFACRFYFVFHPVFCFFILR
ncbi:hypothetical protein [Methanimicrococcus hongohii]|uniref:hypothetical protein n=1 Tax=Methanimicrococcus hongohii TaxID=3028295 RepID=UPI00293027F0|nr:hypothetical protein [Methanimicrococcus sp. Hf6]